MIKPLTTLFLLTLFSAGTAAIAQAQTPTPLCAALRNEKIYEDEKSLKSYRYLAPGLDQWIFRTSSDTKDDFKIDRYGLKKMADLQTILRARGTELVIALVPSRGLVADSKIDRANPWTRAYKAETALENYRRVLGDLNKAGIPAAGIVDFAPYRDTFFYKQDQHWSPAGARATAQTVADLIKTLPVYQTLSKQLFETVPDATIDYTGTYAERIADVCKSPVFKESLETYKTTEKKTTFGSRDLFGQTKFPEVALVGTSNSVSTAAHANFDGALKQYLSADVYNAAVSGGGFETSLLAYLASPDFKNHPPKVLIWEFPVYYTITKGSQAGKQMNEFVATALGPCDHDHKITETVNKILFKEITLLSNLSAFSDVTKPTYVALNFESPARRSFKLDSFFEGRESRHYTFQRARESGDLNNYYLLLEPESTPLNRIEIRVKDEMVGLGVKATLCRPALPLEAFVKNLDTDGKDSDETPSDAKTDEDE